MEIAKNRKGKLELELNTIEDKIQAYTIGHYDWENLTETEKRIYQRWVSIRNLSLTEFSPNQTVKAHLQLLKEKGIEISERTAWSDYRNAMEMWGNNTKISYQAKLAKYEEYLLSAMKLAFEEKDTKSLGSLVRALIELAKQIKEQEMNADDYDEPNQFILAVKFSESEKAFTIDLDDFEVMPTEEQQSMLMDAVDNHNMSEVEFRKMIQKDKE